MLDKSRLLGFIYNYIKKRLESGVTVKLFLFLES